MFIRTAWLSAKGAKDDKNANAWRSSPFQNIVISLFFSFIFVQIFPRCYTPIFDGLVLVKMQPVHRHRYHHHPTAARKSKPGYTLPWLIINMIGIIGGALSIFSGSAYPFFFDFIRHGLRQGSPRGPKWKFNGILPNSVSTPSPLKQTDALWELFSPKISQSFKTAVLTLEMDIFTITMAKYYS